MAVEKSATLPDSLIDPATSLVGSAERVASLADIEPTAGSTDSSLEAVCSIEEGTYPNGPRGIWKFKETESFPS